MINTLIWNLLKQRLEDLYIQCFFQAMACMEVRKRFKACAWICLKVTEPLVGGCGDICMLLHGLPDKNMVGI